MNPEVFNGLESDDSCNDDNLHNHFTLTCTASITMETYVTLPPLKLVWKKNNIPYYFGVTKTTLQNGTTIQTNLTNALAYKQDSGNYTCEAKVEICSTTISKEATTVVIINGSTYYNLHNSYYFLI